MRNMLSHIRVLVIAALALTAWSALAQGGKIHDAAEAGDLEKVKTLLAADPSLVNSKLDNGATPLLFALQSGKTDVAKFLLEKGADAKAASNTGVSSLYLAAGNGQLDVVNLLLDKGADVNAKTETDCTSLLIASANGQLDVVKLLLEKGADVNAQASYNTIHESATPLIDACKVSDDFDRLGGGPLGGNRVASKDKKQGYLELVKALLDKKANTDVTDNFGHTALFYAASNGQVEVVKLLLDSGAGADIDGHNHNGTPLLFAAQNGDIEIVKMLLAKGANPNAECNSKDKEGKPWTPLKIAQAKGFKDVVDLLQKAASTRPAQ